MVNSIYVEIFKSKKKRRQLQQLFWNFNSADFFSRTWSLWWFVFSSSSCVCIVAQCGIFGNVHVGCMWEDIQLYKSLFSLQQYSSSKKSRFFLTLQKYLYNCVRRHSPSTHHRRGQTKISVFVESHTHNFKNLREKWVLLKQWVLVPYVSSLSLSHESVKLFLIFQYVSRSEELNVDVVCSSLS